VTWDLRLGSCLDPVTGLASLADRSIDHIISDPPYSAHVDANFATLGKHKGGKFGAARPRQERVKRKAIGIGVMTDADIVRYCAQICRVTKAWMLNFCAHEQIGEYKSATEVAGGQYVRACAWEKPDGTPQLTGDRPATWGESFTLSYASREEWGDLIAVASMAELLGWNAKGKRGLYRYGVCRGAERSDHPTQKPLALMMELIEDFTKPGDTVCDPFAGSGTTGVACNRLGRNFIGWELSPDYHAIAARRLSGEQANATPEQPGLFDALTTRTA
jgi:site-specific DNA-methyltransferase (adenine-specific)